MASIKYQMYYALSLNKGADKFFCHAIRVVPPGTHLLHGWPAKKVISRRKQLVSRTCISILESRTRTGQQR